MLRALWQLPILAVGLDLFGLLLIFAITILGYSFFTMGGQ